MCAQSEDLVTCSGVFRLVISSSASGPEIVLERGRITVCLIGSGRVECDVVQ